MDKKKKWTKKEKKTNGEETHKKMSLLPSK